MQTVREIMERERRERAAREDWEDGALLRAIAPQMELNRQKKLLQERMEEEDRQRREAARKAMMERRKVFKFSVFGKKVRIIVS